MSPLDSFWTGVLSLLSPIVTPDWGKLIGLIPFLVMGLVLLYLALMARAWLRLNMAQPARGPKLRKPNFRPLLAAHLVVAALGIVTVAAAFIVGSSDPTWKGGTPAFGLVVSIPLLLAGLVLVIASAGSLIRAWDRNGRTDLEPDLIDRAFAWRHRYPGRANRIVAFVVGVLLAAVGLGLGKAPGATTPQPADAAVVPVLLLGLVLAVGAVGSGIAAMWTNDPDFDAPAGDESSALVPAKH